MGDLIKCTRNARSCHATSSRCSPNSCSAPPGMKRHASRHRYVAGARSRPFIPRPSGRGAPATSRTTCSACTPATPSSSPSSNLRFALSAPLIASVYLGDGLSFALYNMATHPDLYERIRAGSRRPLRQRRSGRPRTSPRKRNRHHAPPHHGVHAHVPHRPRVDSERDERLRRWRATRSSRREREINIAQSASHYMERHLPRSRSPSISTATCRRVMNTVIPVTPPTGWARTPASDRAGWSCSSVGQSAHARALLHDRGDPLGGSGRSGSTPSPRSPSGARRSKFHITETAARDPNLRRRFPSDCSAICQLAI